MSGRRYRFEFTTLSFAPRSSWLGPLFHRVFRLAFALRHRNLRRLFGRA